jgi:hypothetical protein
MTRIDHLLKADKISRRLKLEQPKTVEDLLIKCGLSLKYIESGGFRDVYKINGADLVVKLPIDSPELQRESHNAYVHTDIEWDYRRMVMRLKKYEFFRPYMPVLHCRLKQTGVVLGDYYRPLSYNNHKFDGEIDQIIGHLVGIGVLDGDVGPDKKDNYGIDRAGNLRILDLGCFGGELE